MGCTHLCRVRPTRPRKGGRVQRDDFPIGGLLSPTADWVARPAFCSTSFDLSRVGPPNGAFSSGLRERLNSQRAGTTTELPGWIVARLRSGFKTKKWARASWRAAPAMRVACVRCLWDRMKSEATQRRDGRRGAGTRDYQRQPAGLSRSPPRERARRRVAPPASNASSQRASVCATNVTSLSVELDSTLQAIAIGRGLNYYPLWSPSLS